MQSLLLKSTISAHHGVITRENELLPTLELLRNHPEIDMLEIDFVYDNGKFISSHDYEEEKIVLGSEITNWFNKIIPLNKIIWIDIKDFIWSFLSEKFSKFDIEVFFDLIRSEKKRFAKMNIQLETHILIGCQYEHLIDKIIKINAGEFLLAHDFPRIDSYIVKTITPACMHMMVDQYVQENSELIINEMIKEKCNIICLDSLFFTCTSNLIDLLNKIDNISVIIIYSLDLAEQIKITIPGKHVIIQYNYTEYC